MTDITEFIVESIDTSDNTWKFYSNIQELNSNEIQNLNGGIAKKFTSLATNATIFRWRFGDQPGNPIIETTVNPYIYRFRRSGTYSVSHQSCYPCLSTGTLICSNGWCIKSITVQEGKGSLVALAGLAGLFIIAKGDNCCDLRKRCAEKRAICAKIKPEDIENIKECNIIEKECTARLEDCRKKCIRTGHTWKPLPYKCIEKREPNKEICQTVEHQKRYRKEKKDQEK
jgi:hypothetical protein